MDATWVSVAAVIIALCTGLFTAWQVLVQRRHNRVSVRPLVLHQTEWGELVVHQPDGRAVGFQGTYFLKLTNFGLGTAKITGYRVRLDDVDVGLGTANLRQQLQEILPYHDATILRLKSWETAAPFWIKQDGFVEVIDVVFQASGQPQVQRVLEYLKRFHVSAEYESFYGEKERVSSRA